MEYQLTVKTGNKTITVSTNFDFGVAQIISMIEKEGKYEVVSPKNITPKKSKQGRDWTPEARKRQSEIMKRRWSKNK